MKKILILAFLLLFPQYGETAENAAAKIQDYYASIKGFSADFTQLLEHKESGSREARNGKLNFQKPFSIRWQTAKPHEETLVVTSKEIWDYLPDEEIVYRYSPQLAQDSHGIIQVITGQAPINKDFEIKDNGKDKGLNKLTLYPKEPSMQMVEGIIWVDPESGRITRAKITDFYGNSNELTLKNFKPNPGFSSGTFRFTPPKGIEVEDRTERKVEERELFK